MSKYSITHSTFALERTYPAPTDRVFRAWADAEIKARWFADDSTHYELDFRPNGIERNCAIRAGKRMTWESLYREIVPNERIVYTSVLSEEATVVTASLTTVEFASAGNRTTTIRLVESGAYLDGREKPEWREQGTSVWLEALGRDLMQDATS
jgi:uncharacterized protein YndB with AHSA1/START domain